MPGGFENETRAGQAIQAQGYTFTPFSRLAQIITPNRQAGFIWNRPSSILVRAPDGTEQVLRVPDPTRSILWLLLGMCLGAFLLTIVIGQQKNKLSRKEKTP